MISIINYLSTTNFFKITAKLCGYSLEYSVKSNLEVFNVHSNETVILNDTVIDDHSDTIVWTDKEKQQLVETSIYKIVKNISDKLNWNMEQDIIIATSPEIKYSKSFGTDYFPILKGNNDVDICLFSNDVYIPVQKPLSLKKIYNYEELFMASQELISVNSESTDNLKIENEENISSSHSLINKINE